MRNVLVALLLSALLSGAGWQTPRALSAEPTPPPPVGPSTPTPTAGMVPPVVIPACQMSYYVIFQWAGGFEAFVTIKNNSARTIRRWQGRWTWPDWYQGISNVYTEAGGEWRGSWREEGNAVVLDSYNSRYDFINPVPIPPGETFSLYLVGMYHLSNRTPTDLRCIIIE